MTGASEILTARLAAEQAAAKSRLDRILEPGMHRLIASFVAQEVVSAAFFAGVKAEQERAHFVAQEGEA